MCDVKDNGFKVYQKRNKVVDLLNGNDYISVKVNYHVSFRIVQRNAT